MNLFCLSLSYFTRIKQPDCANPPPVSIVCAMPYFEHNLSYVNQATLYHLFSYLTRIRLFVPQFVLNAIDIPVISNTGKYECDSKISGSVPSKFPNLFI